MEDIIPFPVVDFHVHPKRPTAKMTDDFHAAGVKKAVILATDTYREDVDREDVRRHVAATYRRSDISHEMSFEFLLQEIRESLCSSSHIGNEDVIRLQREQPKLFVGFGSADLCRGEFYVENTLSMIWKAGLHGVKLLPYSQFFNPEESASAELLMDFCGKHGLIVLSHTGCSSGVFESPYLSGHCRPSKWQKLALSHKEVPLVLAHFGAYSAMYPGIWLEEAIDLMACCDNVYADTAAVWRMLQNEAIVSLIRKRIGFDRVLFGTDYPMPTLIPGGEQEVVIEILNNSYLTMKEKRAILGGNALSLLQISV